MVSLIRWYPLRHHGRQTPATRLLPSQPDRFQYRNQLFRLIPSRPRKLSPSTFGFSHRHTFAPQGSNGGLAMISHQFNSLVDQLASVLQAGVGVTPPQLCQHLLLRCLTHIFIHRRVTLLFDAAYGFLSLNPSPTGNNLFDAIRYFAVLPLFLSIRSHPVHIGARNLMNQAVFLDRDGTIIHERNYLSRPEDVAIFPGIPAALKQL